MLKKLMKYEFKATGRVLLPLYGTLLLFALINRFIFSGSLDESINKAFGTLGNIANLISVFAYGCTMAAVFAVTFFVIVQRFYKNILGDEGYLMNTLPIKPSTNILNKILVSVLWTIISCFVTFISILILFVNFNNVTIAISEFTGLLKVAYSYYGNSLYLLFFGFCLNALVNLTKSITMIYAAISIGHLFNKSKILFSIGAFIGLSIISNLLNSILMYIGSQINLSQTTLNGSNLILGFLLISIIISLIYLMIYFLITNYILTKRLNLE